MAKKRAFLCGINYPGTPHALRGCVNDVTTMSDILTRNFGFRFLRKDLVAQNVVPQIGDVILWNNDYYEVNLVNENQDIVGKVPQYNYGGAYLDNFGASFSIICFANYVSPELLGITQSR